MVFSAGVNYLQVDQVNKEIDKQTSTYKHLVASKVYFTHLLSILSLYMPRPEYVGGVYTKTFSVENEYFSLRFSLPFTPQR